MGTHKTYKNSPVTATALLCVGEFSGMCLNMYSSYEAPEVWSEGMWHSNLAEAQQVWMGYLLGVLHTLLLSSTMKKMHDLNAFF